MWETIFAFALVIQPEFTPTESRFAALAPQVRQVCIGLGLFDQTCWVMKPDRDDFDFQADLDNCRHWHAATRDAPSADDVYRLPTVQAVTDWMAFNRQSRRHWEMVAASYCGEDGYNGMQPLLNEYDRLYWTLDYVRAAWNHTGWWRRHYLKLVRQMAGEDAYYSGRFDWVPLQAFREVR